MQRLIRDPKRPVRDFPIPAMHAALVDCRFVQCNQYLVLRLNYDFLVVVVAKRFAAVGTFPGSQLNHFVNTVMAEGMTTRLDDSVFEVLPTYCAISELTEHFMLF